MYLVPERASGQVWDGVDVPFKNILILSRVYRRKRNPPVGQPGCQPILDKEQPNPLGKLRLLPFSNFTNHLWYKHQGRRGLTFDDFLCNIRLPATDSRAGVRSGNYQAAVCCGQFIYLAQTALRFIAKNEKLPPRLLKPPRSAYVSSVIPLLISAFFLYNGLYTLYLTGFCSQSLGCIIWRLIR
jgi:hypothetical protein